MKLQSFMLALASASVLIFGAGATQAATVTLVLDQFATGSNTASGAVTTTFTELSGADAGEVRLDISLAGLTTSSEFISDLLLNFSGTASDLIFTRIGGTGPDIGHYTIASNNNITNNGLTKNTGDYDIVFSFETGNGPKFQRFNAGETLSFNIDSSIALAAAMFNIKSTGTAQNDGPYAALAHIQGLANDKSVTMGAKPGVAAVPGPIAGAGLPALMALGGFVWARRRKAVAAA